MDLVKKDLHTTIVKNLVAVFVAHSSVKSSTRGCSCEEKPHSLSILQQSYTYSSDSVYDRLILSVKVKVPNKESKF